MHLQSIFCLQLIIPLCAGSTPLIRDYFLFKNVTRVSGLCCGNCENKYEIVQTLNNIGIIATVKEIGSNVDVLRFLQTDYWNLGIYLDLRCSMPKSSIIQIFNETSASYMFDHLHQWLILANNMNQVVEVLNDSTFSIITDLVVSLPKNRDYVLYDVYNHCKHCGGTLNITKLGSWSEADGINVTLLENIFSRRRNYHKIKAKVGGIVIGRPESQDLIEYLQDRSILLKDNWAKFGYAVLTPLAGVLNVTFDFIELKYWYRNDSNGPMFNGFRTNDFDLGFYPSLLTHQRLNIANALLQMLPARSCFMFITVPSTKVDMNTIFRPFEKIVWYMLCIFMLLMMFALWMTLKLERINNHSDYGTTVLIVIAALCQQGLPALSNKFASRIAFLQTLIFGLLVYNYYSAAIVSSRINAPLDKMNDSLYSLANSKLKLSSQQTVLINLLLNFPGDKFQYFRKRWEAIPSEKRIQSIEDGVKEIMKPGYAYHADPYHAYPLIERMFTKQMICQLTEVHWFEPASLAIWSSKNNQFNEIIKIWLIRTYTAGIRNRESIRWTSRKPYCDKDEHYTSSVTFVETIPNALVFFAGVLLSIAICFTENIVFRALQARKKLIR